MAAAANRAVSTRRHTPHKSPHIEQICACVGHSARSIDASISECSSPASAWTGAGRSGGVETSDRQALRVAAREGLRRTSPSSSKEAVQ